MHAEMINSVQVSLWLSESHWQHNAARSYNKIKYTYFAIMRTPSQRKTETEIAYHSQSIACIVYTCDRRKQDRPVKPPGNRAGLPSLFTRAAWRNRLFLNKACKEHWKQELTVKTLVYWIEQNRNLQDMLVWKQLLFCKRAGIADISAME